VALNGDRPQDAERIADEILKLDPRNGAALQVRGCALLKQKRAADALAPLQAAAQSLRDAETDTLLAMAPRQTGRTDEALSRLKRAIKRQPPYAPAFHELGYLLMSLEHYDEAIEALRRGLEIAAALDSARRSVTAPQILRRGQSGFLPARLKSCPIPPTRCSVLPRRINRSARLHRPPPITAAASCKRPTIVRAGSISDTACYSLASSKPVTIASAPLRVPTRSVTAKRLPRLPPRVGESFGSSQARRRGFSPRSGEVSLLHRHARALVPGIHVFNFQRKTKGVDGRNKSGHDRCPTASVCETGAGKHRAHARLHRAS
jgi:hypothetical protein